MLDLTESSRRYQEMYVDGGVTSQVFLFPLQLIQMLVGDRAGQRRSTTVAREAIDAFIEVQAVNDLYRFEEAAERNGEQFNVAYIESDFDFPH